MLPTARCAPGPTVAVTVPPVPELRLRVPPAVTSVTVVAVPSTLTIASVPVTADDIAAKPRLVRAVPPVTCRLAAEPWLVVDSSSWPAELTVAKTGAPAEAAALSKAWASWDGVYVPLANVSV